MIVCFGHTHIQTKKRLLFSSDGITGKELCDYRVLTTPVYTTVLLQSVSGK